MKIIKHLRSDWFRYGFETLAVIVGILAAFALENWSENRREQDEVQDFKIALYADLAKDTFLIRNNLDLLIKDTLQLHSFVRRMSDNQVGLDTLIQIARYEFNPWMYANVAFNKSTILSLQSTGKLGLLDPWLQDALMTLNELQQSYRTNTDLDIQMYLDQVKDYNKKYPFNDRGHIYPDSKISKLIWDDVQFRELAIDLNSIIALKFVTDYPSVSLL